MQFPSLQYKMYYLYCILQHEMDYQIQITHLVYEHKRSLYSLMISLKGIELEMYTSVPLSVLATGHCKLLSSMVCS